MDEEPGVLAEHCEYISVLVQSGFFNEADLADYLADLVDDPQAAGLIAGIEAHARTAFAAKRAAEADWPAVTDWDRLDAAFSALAASGILALHNAGYTTSDAHGDAWDIIGGDPEAGWRGFAFYHAQDVERAIEGAALFVGFDAVAQGRAAKQAVGEEIMSALRGAGFVPDWNAGPETRLCVPGLVWHKRIDWLAPAAPDPGADGPPRGFWHKLLGR